MRDLELALKALAKVESGGTAWVEIDGEKRPVILFERHILWRQLRKRGINPEPLALDHPELCGSRWRPKEYSYGTHRDQWEKLEKVVEWAKDNQPRRAESYRKAALESCSWGLYQILGLHYRACGLENVDRFVEEIHRGEARQKELVLKFLESRPGALECLKSGDWQRFARIYNGTANWKSYAWRLAEAYWRIEKGVG